MSPDLDAIETHAAAWLAERNRVRDDLAARSVAWFFNAVSPEGGPKVVQVYGSDDAWWLYGSLMLAGGVDENGDHVSPEELAVRLEADRYEQKRSPEECFYRDEPGRVPEMKYGAYAYDHYCTNVRAKMLVKHCRLIRFTDAGWKSEHPRLAAMVDHTSAAVTADHKARAAADTAADQYVPEEPDPRSNPMLFPFVLNRSDIDSDGSDADALTDELEAWFQSSHFPPNELVDACTEWLIETCEPGTLATTPDFSISAHGDEDVCGPFAAERAGWQARPEARSDYRGASNTGAGNDQYALPARYRDAGVPAPVQALVLYAAPMYDQNLPFVVLRDGGKGLAAMQAAREAKLAQLRAERDA